MTTVTYPSIQINLGGGDFVNFVRDQIVDASIVEEINLVSVELSVNALEFTVNNSVESFNMFNGEIYTKLKEHLEIEVYEYIDNTSVYIGLFYLKTWKNLSDTQIKFTAVDIVGILADTDFEGIFWDTPVTLTEAMGDVFNPISVEFEIDSSIASRTISGWIAPSTYRDALQQICFAGRAVPLTARTNKLSLQPINLPIAYRDYVITTSEAKQNEIEVNQITSRIEIISHNYSESGVLETIFDKYLEAGSHKIVFDKPYYGIVIDGAGYVPAALGTEDGNFLGTEDNNYFEAGGDFTLGSNSVYINITEGAQITITGYAWLDSKRSFTFNETGTETVKNKRNLLIQDATLVNSDRAQDVLDGLRDFYRLRYLQDVTFLPSEIKVTDIVLSDAFNSQRIIGSITKSELNLTGGFLSNSKVFGILPNYVLPSETPVRVARVGIAQTGIGLTRNNAWRRYD